MKQFSAFFTITAAFSLLSFSSAFAQDKIEDSKKLCHYQAVEKSNFDPTKSKSSNTIAKGAGAGAVSGVAVRAIQGKSLLKGAVIGAGAGAAGGALKKNRDKKQAVLSEALYKSEYENCLRKRGLNPENVK